MSAVTLKATVPATRHNGREGPLSAARTRSKNGEPFRRRTTVKSVAEVQFEACYPAQRCSRHDPHWGQGKWQSTSEGGGTSPALVARNLRRPKSETWDRFVKPEFDTVVIPHIIPT